MTRKNFYTSAIANTVDTVKIGIQALAEAATKLQASSALIIGKSKSSLNGLVADVIGEAAVKALQKGQAVRLSKGPSLEFHYGNGIPQSANGSPLLVCFPDKKLMQSVDAITNAPVLIVLPWILDDINPWLLAHGATDLLNVTSAPPISITNPVVEEALKTILALINVSTGIVHPSDKATVVGIFKALQKANEQYDPEEVDAWLIQQGMDGKHAAKIGEVAANPTGFRATSDLKKWGPSDVKRWRDAVKSSSERNIKPLIQ